MGCECMAVPPGEAVLQCFQTLFLSHLHCGSLVPGSCIHRHSFVQRYFGTAIGKGRQSAKTDIEKLKLTELTCRQGVVEVAKM